MSKRSVLNCSTECLTLPPRKNWRRCQRQHVDLVGRRTRKKYKTKHTVIQRAQILQAIGWMAQYLELVFVTFELLNRLNCERQDHMGIDFGEEEGYLKIVRTENGWYIWDMTTRNLFGSSEIQNAPQKIYKYFTEQGEKIPEIHVVSFHVFGRLEPTAFWLSPSRMQI